MEEGGEEVRVVDGDGDLDEDILVAEVALLEAVGVSASRYQSWKSAYLSVVNLPSLYAVMKAGESL